jgi:hypothetical protein
MLDLHSLCRAVHPAAKVVILRANPTLLRFGANRSLLPRYARSMSATSHQRQPEVIGTEELKTEAKWLKLERIKWKDQEGKEVGTTVVLSVECPGLAAELMQYVPRSGSGRSPIERLEGRAGWIVRHANRIHIATL